ncbi:DUF4124 domain-containing protein [Photobacterium nomapromontoriensis]|uniref:DUF4124 domain-containing protein n=1 Tax=Photobacterium nomapromontoriensis TaxID=2910237 RepID=UPI003D0AE2B3
MKTLYFILLSGLICSLHISTATADTIYSWEDDDGVVHFSDQPHPEAKPLEIKPPKIQSAPEPAADTVQADIVKKAEDNAAFLPPEVILLSPAHQATLRDNSGNITVTASSNRKLNKGHTVRLRLDGNISGRSQTQLDWQLNHLDRGSHTLQIELLKYGKVIASSDKITVYLHRASIKQQKPSKPMPK